MKKRWDGVDLRGNFYSNTKFDAGVEGADVKHRISLRDAKPGRYKYVVDENGAFWVGNPDRHSALIPKGKRVYAAGHVRIDKHGVVSLNSASGHYMAEEPLLGEEAVRWKAAMRITIQESGKKAGNLVATQGEY